MFASKKLAILVILVMIAPLVLAACGPTPEPETIVKTVVVEQTKIVEKEGEKVTIVETVEVTVPPPTATPVPEAKPVDYKIALFEDPVSTNYWNYLGPGSSVWTAYILSGHAASLYGLSDQRYQFIPSLAKEIVDPVDNGDGTWSFTIPMVEDAKWSDGEPVTAEDVCFTHNTCKDLQLTQNWPNSCKPMGVEVDCEVVDEYTVKYTFHEKPSLGTWQAGVAMAPILPKHYWQETVDKAYSFIEGLEEPTIEPPKDAEGNEIDCFAEELSDEDAAACEPYLAEWEPYNEAFENARKTLYEADGTGAVSFGGYVTTKLEPGAFAQREQNPNYYFKGAEIIEYEDDTWMLKHPNGTVYQLYGDAQGEVTLDYTKGPYAPNIIFSIYGSQDAAFLALADGEVDYVLNPLGLSKGLEEQAKKGEGIKTYVNPDYGMYYLAFNMRKKPMSYYGFRKAVDAVIDKEFVVDKVLGGVVFPMYSTMPPGNEFWFNPEAEKNEFKGMTREERVNAAVQILKEEGWSWTKEPAWNEDKQDVDPGEGITMPDGNPMPELTILGPGPAYDPLRATFNQWISEWMRELGMPVKSELTGFNTILGPVFIDADFDMYILGWSLGNVAFPDYYEAFWASWNDTATTGNYNTPGFNNAEYDELVNKFMSTADLEEARDLVFQMQMLLADQRPYICLFYKQTIDLARDNLIFPYTELLGGIESAAGFQTDTIPLSK